MAGATAELPAELVDRLLEALIAPSFSRFGYEVRSKLQSWEPPPSMAGQTAVVTGATSGLGLAISLGLAGLGAELHLVGRDPDRGAAALEAVRRAGAPTAELHLVDLAEPEAVRRLGESIGAQAESIDALVHNAGSLQAQYSTNSEGTEATVATQLFAPYVLTATLAARLCSSRGARIVTMSSGGMYTQRFDLSNLELTRQAYRGAIAYARAKRAQVVLAEAIADRLGPGGVASFSTHPGWADTPGLTHGLPRFATLAHPVLRSPEQGADTAVWLAAGGAAAVNGSRGGSTRGFYFDRRVRTTNKWWTGHEASMEERAALLAWLESRSGIDLPVPRPA